RPGWPPLYPPQFWGGGEDVTPTPATPPRLGGQGGPAERRALARIVDALAATTGYLAAVGVADGRGAAEIAARRAGAGAVAVGPGRGRPGPAADPGEWRDLGMRAHAPPADAGAGGAARGTGAGAAARDAVRGRNRRAAGAVRPGVARAAPAGVVRRSRRGAA